MVLATIESQLVFLNSLAPDSRNWLGPDDVYISFLPLAHIYDR